jgi:hypothetical protein
VGFLVASRHRGTICDPKQRCGNSLALSWIACSEDLEGYSLLHVALYVLQAAISHSTSPVQCSAVLVLKTAAALRISNRHGD